MSPRLTYRKARAFFGGGPSLHLNLLSQYDDYDYSKTTPSFKNGIGLIASGPSDLRIAFSCLEVGEIETLFEMLHKAIQELL